MEKWKKLGSSNYLISSIGNVKSLDCILPQNRQGKQVNRAFKGQNIKLQIHTSGYKMVNIKGYTKFVHRLVALCFLENKEQKEFVNHINGIKDDNRVENLEWCTRKENEKHAFSTGLKNSTGDKNPMSKLKHEDVVKIKSQKERSVSNKKELCIKYGVTRQTIERIWGNKIWRHVYGI